MSILAALKLIKSCMIRPAAETTVHTASMLDREAMLDELRGLFADELAAHDRSARKLALQSASHRQDV